MFKYMYSCNCALKMQYVATANTRVSNINNDVELRVVLSSYVERYRKQIRELLIGHDIFDISRNMVNHQRKISVIDVDIVDDSLIIIFTVDGDPLITSDLDEIKLLFDEQMSGEYGDWISKETFDYIKYECESDDSTIRCYLGIVPWYNNTDASTFNLCKWDSICCASVEDDDMVPRGKLICKFISRVKAPENIDFALSNGGMTLINKEDNSILEITCNNIAYSYTLKNLNEVPGFSVRGECTYSSPLSTDEYGPYQMKRSEKVVKVIDLLRD